MSFVCLCISRVRIMRVCCLGSLQHVEFDTRGRLIGVCLSHCLSYFSGFGRHVIRIIFRVLHGEVTPFVKLKNTCSNNYF